MCVCRLWLIVLSTFQHVVFIKNIWTLTTRYVVNTQLDCTKYWINTVKDTTPILCLLHSNHDLQS